MKRTNTFIIGDHPELWELADNCAKLWNELNFERRQAYVHFKKFEWYPRHLYKRYAPLIGSNSAADNKQEQRGVEGLYDG